MKKLFGLILITIFVLSMVSCTDNSRARNFGGTETVLLKSNEEFVNITWKENDLWIIVKDKNTGNYYAREKSQYGVWQGTVIIKYE